MFERETSRKSAIQKETSLKPTDKKILELNDALMQMRAAFEKRKADPENILIELTSFAEKELGKVPELKTDHRFSSISGLIEKRILPREDA
jgi:hypothetical protein